MTQARRKRLVIAMDGPAGVGKSTVGRLVARTLGYRFVNTGEMYRALTWRALQEKLDLEDAKALSRLARRVRWQFKATRDGVTVRTFIDGRDVARLIRGERVGKNSSTVASAPGVRRHLRMLQRRLGRKGGVVMEGRDITTNVFPDADFKIYLDASVAERAARRTRQLRSQGKRADYASIREAIAARDRQDSRRRINPLRQAKDAVLIDSTNMTLREVAECILKRICR